MPGIEKELMYNVVKDRLSGKTVFMSSYDRIPVKDLNVLRRSVKKNSGKCFVVKKTMLKKFFSTELKVTLDKSFIEGPVFVTTISDEPQKVSKTLISFAKENEKFTVRGVFFEGELKDKAFVKALSEMPSKEQMIATMLSSMKAPISNFVFCLGGITKSFVVVLNEIKKQKESQGAA